MQHTCIVKTLISLFVAIMLAACRGGGGGGGSSSDGGGGGGNAPPSNVLGVPQLIETDNAGHALVAQIAVDGNGNAMAVWYQSDGTRNNIWANRFDATSGVWGAAQLIETNDTGATNPQITVDTNGNAIAVWQQSGGVHDIIWANRFSAASGAWGTAQPIMFSNPVGAAIAPQIAMDGNGNAIAVWYEFDGSRYNIWANRFSAAGGFWDLPQPIEFDNAGAASNPQIVLNAGGNAIVVWEQSDGTRYNIWANHFSVANGAWGAPQLIETGNGDALRPQIVIDAAGNAIAVWYQHDSLANIWANRFSAASGAWGTAQLIETDNAGEARNPQIALDGNGNAMAVWHQSDGTRHNIWANRFSAASGAWGAPQLLEIDDSGDANLPQIALDAGGNAVAVWQQSDGARYDIWINRFNTTSGSWGTPQLIEGDNTGEALGPEIAIDAGGHIVTVWEQSDGPSAHPDTRYNVWANRFQ